MNLFRKNSIAMLSSLALAITFSSCQDKANDYAPELNIGGYTSSNEIAPGNLTAYWSFNDNLTDSISKITGVNTGTIFGSGIKGRALQGALDAYVVSNTPEAVQNLKSFTTTMWVNTSKNTKGVQGILDIANSSNFWGNVSIYMDMNSSNSNAVLKMHVNNAGIDGWVEKELTSFWDNWVQIGVSYNQTTSTFKVYINGSNILTQVVSNYGPLVFQNGSKMVFGTLQFQTSPSLTTSTGKQDWGSYLTGKLDEVRIYNKALSEEEISALQRLEARNK